MREQNIHSVIKPRIQDHKRTRECNNPTLKYDGIDCNGNDVKSRLCNKIQMLGYFHVIIRWELYVACDNYLFIVLLFIAVILNGRLGLNAVTRSCGRGTVHVLLREHDTAVLLWMGMSLSVYRSSTRVKSLL